MRCWDSVVLAILGASRSPKPYLYPQRTHVLYKDFGPQDPIIQGFWVILMLRAIFLNPKPCMNPTSQNNPWLLQLMVSLDSGFRIQGLGLGDGNRAMDPYDSPLRSSIASFVRVEGAVTIIA